MCVWRLSHRFDKAALPIADRHYNRQKHGGHLDQSSAVVGMGHSASELGGSGRDQPQRGPQGRIIAPWVDSAIIPCRDGRARRTGAKPGDEPLAARIPADLGRREPALRRMAKRARRNRVGRLRGYGNSIVPQLAAVFIRGFMEC